MAAQGCSRAKQRRQRTHKKFYDAYRNGERYEVNKARKLARHLKRFPRHQQSLDRLKAIAPHNLRRAGVVIEQLKLAAE